jgi:hypothetical protein
MNDCCDGQEPIKLKWNSNEKNKVRVYRNVAAILLNTNVAVHTAVSTVSDDAAAFVSSLIGVLPLEAQLLIFGVVAENGGIAALLCLSSCCRWMHFVIRTYMHTELQEQACSLACSQISLLPISMPDTYIDQFTMEMRGSLILRLIKKAFSKMALHCAAPHCALAIRAYNQSVIKELADRNHYPQLRNKAKKVFYNNMSRTGVIRVAFATSECLSAAHDAPVAFVASKTATQEGGFRHVIVRLDAGKENTVWCPHSDMAVSEPIELNSPPGSVLNVLWMSASHDGSALLYATDEDYDDVEGDNAKTLLWDVSSSRTYSVGFVSMAGASGVEVEPCVHGWRSLCGWFKKDIKGEVERNVLQFSVMFQNGDVEATDEGPRLWVRHNIWSYSFCRSAKKLVCHRVRLEASDVLRYDDRFTGISSDVSGRWMAARVLRDAQRQTFGCLVDVDSDEDGVIFCCPKALQDGRYRVRAVAVSAAGDKLAMICTAGNNVCVEVHKRISDTACVRLMHMPFAAANACVGPDDPRLRILTFSPCGRFLVWRESEACSDELQGLMSVAVTEDPVGGRDKVVFSKLNTVAANMPRDFCWRACGVWLRLRRGAVLIES